MQLVEQNPFRLIGVLANGKEKDIHRQKVKVRKYISVGKNIDSEFDLPVFVDIVRSKAAVDTAVSEVAQRQDKVENALFWFVNSNDFDEMAISNSGLIQ